MGNINSVRFRKVRHCDKATPGDNVVQSSLRSQPQAAEVSVPSVCYVL